MTPAAPLTTTGFTTRAGPANTSAWRATSAPSG
jgi:hypothetical protein